jgi:hypothetical protein
MCRRRFAGIETGDSLPTVSILLERNLHRPPDGRDADRPINCVAIIANLPKFLFPNSFVLNKLRKQKPDHASMCIGFQMAHKRRMAATLQPARGLLAHETLILVESSGFCK